MKTGEKKIIKIRKGDSDISFIMCGDRVIFGITTKYATFTLQDSDGKTLLDSDGKTLICA